MSTFLDEGRAPVVIDYAYHTASDKRIPVTLSGTFLGLTLSGADIEIGAVEIKDEDSENRAVVHMNADDFANSNVLVTAAETMGYDAAANNWNRIRNVFTDLDDVEEDKINPALAVGAVILGLDESDQFDRMRGTVEYGLEVDATRIQGTSAISGFTMIRDALGHTAEVTADGFLAISGIVNIGQDIEIGAVEIKDAGSNDRAYVGYAVDDDIQQGLSVLSQTLGYNPNDTSWYRIRVANPATDGYDEGDMNPALAVGAVTLGYNATSGIMGYDRIRGDTKYGLDVDVTRVQTTVPVSGTINNVVEVDATGQGDVPITLDGEQVTIAGTVAVSGVMSDVVVTDITGFDTVKGQKVMAESFPVVIAADQTVAISGVINNVVEVDATGQGDIPITLDGEGVTIVGTTAISGTINNVVEVDATGQGDIPVTLDSEQVTIAGTVAISGIITNVVDVNVTSMPIQPITISGDIEIGAVEIKDAGSDIRATVTADYGLEVDVTRIPNITYAISGVISEILAPLTISGDVTLLGTTAISGIITNVVEVDATGQGDVPVTLDGEQITIAGTTAISGIITNEVDVNIISMPIQPITISGDIEIGAVEIKNAGDDSRATVSTDYGLEVDVTRIAGTTAVSGVVIVSQITNPLTISGGVNLLGTTAISGTINNIVNVDATSQGDIPITLDGEQVTIAGTVGVSGIMYTNMYVWDLDEGGWSPIIATKLSVDGHDPDDLSPALFAGTVLYAPDVDDGYVLNRIRGTKDYGLEADVTRIRGTTAISGFTMIRDESGNTALVTPDGFLAISGIVNIGQDIEIGAVEIKDPITDTRARVVSVHGALLVGGRDDSHGEDLALALSDNADGTGDVRITTVGNDKVTVVVNAGATINRLAIDVSSNVNTLVVGVPASKIKVLSCLLVASGTTNIAFRSATASGTRLTGEIVLDAGGAGFVLIPPAARAMHHFETDAGEALVLTIDPTTYVGGYLTYYVAA